MFNCIHSHYWAFTQHQLSLLPTDIFDGHVTDKVQIRYKNRGNHRGIIPRGCALVFLPADCQRYDKFLRSSLRWAGLRSRITIYMIGNSESVNKTALKFLQSLKQTVSLLK